MAKITKAQSAYLHELVRNGGEQRKRHKRTWTFIDRLAEAGLIEIIEGTGALRFPFHWSGERVTEAGRAAISPAVRRTP